MHAKGSMLSAAQAAIFVGRIAMVGLLRFVKDRNVLVFFTFGSLALTIAAAFTPGIEGVVCAIMITI
jgi:fucose permease